MRTFFDKEIFAERIRELRKDRGLTMEKLAKAIGLTHPTISDWESGKISPSVESIFLLAKFFNISAGYLIGTEN